MALAWHVENFRRHDRAKPLPDLRKVLRQLRGGEQAGAELVDSIYAVAGLYGLKVKVRKRIDGKHQAGKS